MSNTHQLLPECNKGYLLYMYIYILCDLIYTTSFFILSRNIYVTALVILLTSGKEGSKGRKGGRKVGRR